MDEIKWLPLEANPELFKKYAEMLGAKNLVFNDIYSCDDLDFDYVIMTLI